MPIYTPLRFRISPSPRNPKKKRSPSSAADGRVRPAPDSVRSTPPPASANAAPPRGPRPHRRRRARQAHGEPPRPVSAPPPPRPTPVTCAASFPDAGDRRRRVPPPRRRSPLPPRPTTTTAAARGSPRRPGAPARAARLHAGAAPAASSPTGGRVSSELRLRLLQCSGAASVSVRFQISDPPPPPVDFCPETLVFYAMFDCSYLCNRRSVLGV